MILKNITAEVPFLWKPMIDRPSGVHLSDILKLMREEFLNQVYPDDQDLKPEEMQSRRLMREYGFMYESICEIGYADRIMPRPEPWQFAGIWVSPDGAGVSQENGLPRIDEIKFTDSYRDPSGMTHWLWQIKVYCLAYGAQHARFYVCHHSGIQRGGLRPLPQVYELEFGTLELIENWEMIVAFAKSKGMIQ